VKVQIHFITSLVQNVIKRLDTIVKGQEAEDTHEELNIDLPLKTREDVVALEERLELKQMVWKYNVLSKIKSMTNIVTSIYQ
jgi:hypothetical protein